MKNSIMIKRMVGIATLAALVAVLQILSNYITFGPVSITLALIPMVVGAILYGPLTGFGLGVFMGALILTAPSTELFLGFNPFGTVVLCLLKTGLAGLASGWIYKGMIRINALKKAKFPVAVIVAALVAPCINTGLFIFGTAVLFQGLSFVDENGITDVLVPSTGFGDAFTAAVGFVVLTNWLIEFAVSVILAPSIVYLFKVFRMNYDLGFANDFKFVADTVIEEKIENSEEATA